MTMTTETRQQFWGKYRGRVKDNKDPYGLGRLKLDIPDVLGSNTSGWALPSFPFAGAGVGPNTAVGLFLIPPKDAWVWAEFEQGNPDKPIWTGCFFPDSVTALPATQLALTPAYMPGVGIDPDKKILKVGNLVVMVENDALTIEHVAGIIPRVRLKIDGTTVKLSSEAVPGAAPPICATVELSSSQLSAGGMPVKVG